VDADRGLGGRLLILQLHITLVLVCQVGRQDAEPWYGYSIEDNPYLSAAHGGDDQAGGLPVGVSRRRRG
jgi:hypothetical protein